MTILRTQLVGVIRRPARLLLTGLAVLVASFVVFATVLVQQITERTVLDSLSGTPASVDLLVNGSGITTGVLAEVAALPGVAEVAGRRLNGGVIGAGNLDIEADPGDGPLAVTHLVEGAYPSAPRQIAVTRRTASRMALPVGAVVTLVRNGIEEGAPGMPVDLTVTGIVDVTHDYGFTAYAPQRLMSALFDDRTLDRIDVRLAPGADLGTIQDALGKIAAARPAPPADALPMTVQTGAAARKKEAEGATSGVKPLFTIVSLFVAIAVFAAVLVTTSTFRIVFAQRMRRLALLRAVGAGRYAIVRALIAEGALTGLVAGGAGVLAALALGTAAPPALRAFDVGVSSPGLPFAQAAAVVALAVVITVLAVLAPAAAASRVSPLAALRASATTGSRTGVGVLRWLSGLLFVAGAATTAAGVVVHLPGRHPKNYDPVPMLIAVAGSGALVFLALVTLGPVLIRPVLFALGWPIRRAGPVGRLAVGGIGGAPRRAAAVSTVVALGVTLLAGALVSAASLRTYADRQAAAYAPADLELSAEGSAGITPAMLATARADPGLAHVAPYRRLSGLRIAAEQRRLDAVDLDSAAISALRKTDVTAGTLIGVRPGQVVVSADTADIAGLKVGDRTSLTATGHHLPVTVAGVVPDSAPLGAALLLNPVDLTTLGAPAQYSGLLADASGDGETGRAAGQKALSAVVDGADGYVVIVLADDRDQINRTITTLLTSALGLIGLTVLIALVGVGTTTALSVVERVRESGLLRALGLSRSALRAMLTTESSLFGFIGGVIGLALGVPYAWLALRALGKNVPLALPVWQLAVVFVALIVVTGLAGLLPAGRAARVSPVTALGTE